MKLATWWLRSELSSANLNLWGSDFVSTVDKTFWLSLAKEVYDQCFTKVAFQRSYVKTRQLIMPLKTDSNPLTLIISNSKNYVMSVLYLYELIVILVLVCCCYGAFFIKRWWISLPDHGNVTILFGAVFRWLLPMNGDGRNTPSF